MLLPGRVVVDKAASPRPPEKGGGGGGTLDMEACALYCGEGGSMGRPLNGGGGGGGGGSLWATEDVMVHQQRYGNKLKKALRKRKVQRHLAPVGMQTFRVAYFAQQHGAYLHKFWASCSGALADEYRPFERRNRVEKKRMILRAVEGANSILLIRH